jgi:hypothetical protein
MESSEYLSLVAGQTAPCAEGDDGVSACTLTAMLARFILGLKLAARSISFRSPPPRLAGRLATLPTVGRHWQLSVVNSQRM